jgi:hypothetical protein
MSSLSSYVDKVIKGAEPTDLPVEKPSKIVGRQSQDREGARAGDPGIFFGARRRDDRIVGMSVHGAPLKHADGSEHVCLRG